MRLPFSNKQTATKGPSTGPLVVLGGAKNVDRPRISPPIHLAHYKRKWPSYLPQVSDRDLTAAVIIKTAHRRKAWDEGHHKAWCVENDPELGAALDDINGRSAWFELYEAKPKVLNIEQAFSMSLRRFGSEKLLAWSRSLPRLRDKGELLLMESADDLEPAPDVKGGEGSGGRKEKVKPSAAVSAAVVDAVASIEIDREDASLLEKLAELQKLIDGSGSVDAGNDAPAIEDTHDNDLEPPDFDPKPTFTP